MEPIIEYRRVIGYNPPPELKVTENELRLIHTMRYELDEEWFDRIVVIDKYFPKSHEMYDFSIDGNVGFHFIHNLKFID